MQGTFLVRTGLPLKPAEVQERQISTEGLVPSLLSRTPTQITHLYYAICTKKGRIEGCGEHPICRIARYLRQFQYFGRRKNARNQILTCSENLQI